MCSDRHLTSRASGSGGDGLPIYGAQHERTMPGPMFKPIKNFKAATVEPETKCTFHPHDGRGPPEHSWGHSPGVWPMRPALEADGAGYGAFVVSQSHPERGYMSLATLSARGRAVGSVPFEKVWGPLEPTQGWRRLRLVICGEDRSSPGPSGLLVHLPALEAESDIAAAPGSQWQVPGLRKPQASQL